LWAPILLLVARLGQLLALWPYMVTIPPLGKLSDRVGRKPIAWFGAIGLVVLAFPMILLVRAATPAFVVGALVGVTGDLNRPASYLIIAGVVGLVSLWFLQEPNGRRMWGSPPSAGSRDEAVRLIDRQEQQAA
jgi:MHS family proline/betaine transporter-like MFS transporter